MPDYIDHAALVSAGFGLKGLKTWRTPDGGGWQYTLLHLGSPVAVITEEGNGGALRIDWTNLRWDDSIFVPPNVTPAQEKKALAQGEKSRTARAALAQVTAAQPHVVTFEGMKPMQVNEEMALSAILDLEEIRRLCKKKLAMRLDGKVMTLNRPYDAAMAAHVRAKWPAAIILNESPLYRTV